MRLYYSNSLQDNNVLQQLTRDKSGLQQVKVQRSKIANIMRSHENRRNKGVHSLNTNTIVLATRPDLTKVSTLLRLEDLTKSMNASAPCT
ncbi:unnamed protein product [Amoebophrya sp. A25]|nr:unnamed protein product [Amoebophrya sp. A25]|eukprot:GSA25T00010125001.1